MRTLEHIRVAIVATHLVSIPLIGQVNPGWLTSYEHNSDVGLTIVMDQAGNLYGTGQVGTTGMILDGHGATTDGESDILLMKLDSSGHAIWVTRSGGYCVSQQGDDQEFGYQIALDEQSQRVVVMGRYGSNANFDTIIVQGDCADYQYDSFVAGYDTAGTCLWANGVISYGGRATSLLLGPASTTFVFHDVGNVTVFPGPPYDQFDSYGSVLAKYDLDGVRISTERVMRNGVVQGAAWSGTDLLICGRYQGQDSLWDSALTSQAQNGEGYLALVNALGHVMWTTLVRSNEGAAFSSCRQMPSGNYLALGYLYGEGILGADTLVADLAITPLGDTLNFGAFIAMFDPNGTPLWVKSITSSAFFTVNSWDLGSDGFIYIQGSLSDALELGTITLYPDQGPEMYLVKLDTLGNCVASLQAGRVFWYGSGDVLANDRGIFLSCNYFTPTTIAGSAIPCGQSQCVGTFIAKFDSLDGFSSISRFAEPSTILHIFANPNNGLCTIELPQGVHFSNDLLLRVFDNTGRLIQELELIPNGGSIPLDIRAQPQGLYHVELSSGSQRFSGRIIFE